MLLSVAVLALLASVQGRAVNISNTWVLPEEGFPVFYRYFRDRISWYEADAVCQFHHANLVTVDTTAQYDAVRAYLKELDISSAVWVGLIRSNPDGDFTWTDYRGLSGDGYWSSAPDARSAPLCAAADPAADYRWEARACGGPTVASFICELPVPQWALGNEGCMIRALPALTILYLPESAAVQLTADCGMAGVKKVQCTGNVKREDLLKELSCADDEEMSSTPSLISTTFNWPASTDSTFADQDTTNDETTEETMSTELETDINQAHDVATSLPHFIYQQTQYKNPIKMDNLNQDNTLLLTKTVNLGGSQDNNIHSNFIPKIVDENSILTNDQLEKLEDERHMKHKMLHEEIAKVGNVENIFTQPTDHFIPPLVMAKAKISDDMTVLSLAEKHAQQLAEKQFSKQNLNKATSSHLSSDNYGISSKSFTENVDKPFKLRENKKEALKSNLPKKYINEKHYDVKNKISKNIETKTLETDKTTEFPLTTESNTKEAETTTKKNHVKITEKSDIEEDSSMDLTVFLKDSPVSNEDQTKFSGDVVKMETIQNNTSGNYTDPDTYNIDITLNKQVEFITTPETTVENNTLHHVIKITSVARDDAILHNITVYTLTTKMPVFRDSLINNNFTITQTATVAPEELHNAENATQNYENITSAESETTTDPALHYTSNISTSLMAEKLTTAKTFYTSTETTTSTEILTTTSTRNPIKMEDVEVKNVSNTTTWPITTITATAELDNNTTSNVSIASNETIDKSDGINNAEYHELLINTTDHQHIGEEDLSDSDFQSPLLSGAVEPMHRPPRTRRPQQPNRNKFNPFRILG